MRCKSCEYAKELLEYEVKLLLELLNYTAELQEHPNKKCPKCKYPIICIIGDCGLQDALLEYPKKLTAEELEKRRNEQIYLLRKLNEIYAGNQ
jgi:hypothetical protein